MFKQMLKPRFIVFQALIAALYAALTLLLYPISFGPIQLRVSEALTVLPFFNPMTTLGLGVGCLIANILGGNGLPDIIFGTLATVIAGILTSRARRDWAAPLPPVAVNALIVGAMLAYVLAPGNFWPSFALFAAEVGFGQALACYGIGLPLLKFLKKHAASSLGKTGLWIQTP